MIAIGGAAINYSEHGLVGIVWIAVVIYIFLNLLLSSFRKIIAIVFALCFIAAGVVLLMISDNNDDSF